MDVSSVLVADLQAPEAVEPGERPFDHPAVASQSFTRLDATPRDARDDAPRPQRAPAAWVIISLIGMQFHGTVAWSPTPLARHTQPWDGLDTFFSPLAAVHI